MAVSCFIRNLRKPFHALITLLVVLNPLFGIGMMKLANPYNKPVGIRDFPVRYPTEDVVFFKSELSSAEEAPLLSLEYAFCHEAIILSSSSLLTRIGSSRFTISCFSHSITTLICRPSNVLEP